MDVNSKGEPRGTVTKHEWRSEIFPGTRRNYWVYVPAQYADLPADRPACLMVFQDGCGYAQENTELRTPIVLDNLIHQGKMPVTIGLYVDAGLFPATTPDREPVSNRSVEYDTLSDRYVRFLLQEILPEVGKQFRLTQDPAGRAICGASSGGICAWTVAWERPDSFSKVYSQVGAFVDLRGGHEYSSACQPSPASLPKGQAGWSGVGGLVRAEESSFCMHYIVYALVSLYHDYRYVGLTQNAKKRIKKHNAEQVRSTAPYVPFAMVLLRQCADRPSARKAEKYFKSGFGRKHLSRLLARELVGLELSSGQIIDLSKCENAE